MPNLLLSDQERSYKKDDVMNLIYVRKEKADLKGYILSIMFVVSFAVFDWLTEYIKETIKRWSKLKKKQFQ